MLEDKFAQHDKVIVDKTVFPDDDYEMSTRDYVVRPSADGDSGPYTITLPPVSLAKGRFYSIVCRNADATNVITITDNEDSECWLGDIEMDGKCDCVLLYSDGMKWFAFGQPADWPGISTTPPPGTTAPPTEVTTEVTTVTTIQ